MTHARTSGRIGLARSVVGTIEIDPDDPLLDGADDGVRQLIERSLGRPMVIRERPPRYRARAPKRRG